MNFKLPVVAPSILAADYAKLGKEIKECTQANIRWLHCDIMDGHFVPNISYGPDVVKTVANCSDAFIDVHLMIENPDLYIEAFVNAGADHITVHQETCPHLHRTIQNIHQHGITAGVAVNPGTSLQVLQPVLSLVDLVLLMSVNPGFGGQSFIDLTYNRLKQLRQLRNETGSGFLIEVDGGVNVDNIGKVVQNGGDVMVAGSAVFKATNIPQRIQNLIDQASVHNKHKV